jgi:serpin B
VYFKGLWANQFNPEWTKTGDFTVSPGTIVQVPMMHDEAFLNYQETGRYQVVELPYETGGEKALSMLVFLPVGDTLAQLEKNLTTQEIAEVRADMGRTKVDLYLPRFRAESGYRLADTLGAMGMPSAFGGAADFSGMDGTQSLAISEVFHQAIINVDETGTEAAAATAVNVAQGIEHLTTFNADHPFLFVIMDRDDGTVLFMGRIMNPNGN